MKYHDELELPDHKVEIGLHEDNGIDLVDETDGEGMVCEVCELGTGHNGVAVEVTFNDELRLPAHGAEEDINPGTVTMLLDEVELGSEDEDCPGVVLPLVTRAVVLVELAADPGLDELKLLMDVEDPISEETKV